MTTNKQLLESDKELDRYLSVGIAQTEEERDRYKAECEKLQTANAHLHAAIRRLCNLYVVYDHYDGQLREELLDKAVIQAISAAMETTQ